MVSEIDSQGRVNLSRRAVVEGGTPQDVMRRRNATRAPRPHRADRAGRVAAAVPPRPRLTAAAASAATSPHGLPARAAAGSYQTQPPSFPRKETFA